MKRLHLLVGSLAMLAFVSTGQLMRHHSPPVPSLGPELHLMYVSRHIYILGAAVANLLLGLYLPAALDGWRRAVRRLGSVLFLSSPLFLSWAFLAEPPGGLAGRSWRVALGLYALFLGTLAHLAAAPRSSAAPARQPTTSPAG